ncbi:MAG: hypothetical protein MJK04_16995, partial [Psychrosphaera sp.]|nr:hypothetical protein [Psychrosphaera sp.]
VQYLQNILGLTPPFPTPVVGYRNFAIDEGVTISTNATDIGIWGEGVDKLIDNNVTIKFNAVIEMPWWIPEYAPDLMPVNEVDAVSVDVALPEAQVLHKYSVSTGNDNTHRDPTTWIVSGSQDGLNWTQLDENSYPQTPQRLTTYHFDVVDNQTAFNYYRFVFDNTQEGDGIGGDNGRLVQIGELALLTEQP